MWNAKWEKKIHLKIRTELYQVEKPVFNAQEVKTLLIFQLRIQANRTAEKE